MRISDWSSDVCSSDLRDRGRLTRGEVERRQAHRTVEREAPRAPPLRREREPGLPQRAQVTLDGPDAELEVLGQLPRRTAPAPRRPTSEERRDGKECVSTSRSRWSPAPTKKTNQ